VIKLLLRVIAANHATNRQKLQAIVEVKKQPPPKPHPLPKANKLNTLYKNPALAGFFVFDTMLSLGCI
jgi:hypothetical protein